jgi:hypothetical protein
MPMKMPLRICCIVCVLIVAMLPASSQSARHPYNSQRKPWPIPGTIEAEDFDEGTKDDPAYYDTTPGSAAPVDEHYRDSDVDIGVDPILHLADVGWVDDGEWLEFSVTVLKTGMYTIATRIATPKDGVHFHFEMNRVNITGSVAVPNTGCWGSDLHGHDCFQETMVSHIRLQQGPYRLRFCPEGSPGQKNLFTVDKFRFALE